MSNLEKLISLAIKQNGVVARFQLSSIGIPRGSRSAILESPLLTRKCHGIYIMKGIPLSWQLNATIAVLSCGPQSLLSHISALINLELIAASTKRGPYQRYKNLERNQFHVVTSRRIQIRSVRAHHRTLTTDDLAYKCIINGIPQVPTERAIIDAARSLEDYELDSALNNALKRNLVTTKSLHRLLKVVHTAPGREKKRIVDFLNHYSSDDQAYHLTESMLEKRVLHLLTTKTNVKICPQFPVTIKGQKYRIDFAIPEKKLAIEVDGFQFHQSRMTFDKDRIRQNDIVGEGWKIIRITAKFTDSQIIETIEKSLD